MKHILFSLVSAVVFSGASAHADSYVDLGKANHLRCRTESGRTVIDVERVGQYQEITAVQDGTLLLLDRVRTTLLVQESFPATYLYKGRTTGAVYLSLSQQTQDFHQFTPPQGSVRYTKDGQQYRTTVTCQVLN